MPPQTNGDPSNITPTHGLLYYLCIFIAIVPKVLKCQKKMKMYKIFAIKFRLFKAVTANHGRHYVPELIKSY